MIVPGYILDYIAISIALAGILVILWGIGEGSVKPIRIKAHSINKEV